jgi:O-antigen/teichoic acid export membrane protein
MGLLAMSDSPTTPAVAPPSGVPDRAARFGPDVVDLRRHAARGTLINAAFQVGLALLLLVRRLVAAAFLTAEEFGVWGVLLGALLLIVFIKGVGTADKFVQQDEPDQERAFQKAFTIDLILGGAALVLAVAALPLVAAAYGESQIIVPGLVLSLAIIGSSFQAPTWIFYRRMDFLRQRLLQAVDPVIALGLTIGLAIGGAGYWSLVIGAVAGSFAGGLVAVIACPYRLRLRLERGTIREYFGFSWPLVVASGGGLAIGNATLLIATRTLGLAQAGAIGMATSITQFTDGVDAIVTRTLYPAVCAVRDRMDLLREAFVKSNRLAMMWGMPFGVGTALFASDFVHYVIGDRWEAAIVVLQAMGVGAALDQIGFNWTAFLRALDWTRPLATLALLNVVTFAVVTAPLLLAFGLEGFAIGFIAGECVRLAARMHYLRRLFEGFGFARHAARAAAPAVLAAAVVGLARLAVGGEREPGLAVAEVALFVVTTAVATFLIERDLLREAFGYLRRRRPAPAAP